MPEQMQPIPVRTPRSRAMRALQGAGVTLALLAGIEAVLYVVAEGAASPTVRLVASALAVGLGVVVAGLRGGPPAALLLLAVVAAMPAGAADRSRSYTVTLATAACPAGTPGQLSDGKEPGLSAGGLRAWNVTACPAAGETFTGAGSLHTCVFRRAPGGPNRWVLSPTFTWDFASITSTTAHPCVTFPDIQLGVNDGDLLHVYPSTTLGVSGGSTVSLYLEGQLGSTP